MKRTGKRRSWYRTTERGKNAERMRLLREERDRKKRCRTCGKAVAKSARTGKPAKLCSGHLAADMLRKLIYILPELVPDTRRQGVESQLCYPLAWRGHLPT